MTRDMWIVYRDYHPMRFKHKKIYLLSSLVIIALVILVLPRPANAAADWLIYGLLGPVFLWIIDFLGGLLVALIQILIGIAQYNDFLNSPAVTKGWIILRDLCNMFFILILLVIAFATVLGSENYNYKKYLFPLIYMAILINFSKMIAGFFIDVSQVIMLQFVNGFKYAAAGNLISSFGMQDLLALRKIDPQATSQMSSEILVSLMLALAMLVTAVVVVGVIVVVFLLRIIALWILVMVSPIAYLAQATPGGQSYSSMWWSTFSKYLIAGPALAFFLWIALAIMAINPTNISHTTNVVVDPSQTEDAGYGSKKAADKVAVGIAKVGQSDRILSFAISIGMLIAALVATQKLGVAGASIAMAAKGKLEAAGKRVAKVGLGIGAVGIGGLPAIGALAGYKGAKVGLSHAKDFSQAGWNKFTNLKGLRALGLSQKAREENAKRRQALYGQRVFGTKGEKGEYAQNLLQQEAKNAGLGTMDLDALGNLAEKNKGRKGLAAILELQKRGHFASVEADDDKAKGMVARVQKELANVPEMLNEFEKGVMKQNQDLAFNTIFNGFSDKKDINRFQAEVTQGNISLDKAILSMDSDTFANFQGQMGTGKDFGKYVKAALNESDLSSLYKNASREKRAAIFSQLDSGDFKTKEQRESFARATGTAVSYNLSDPGQQTAFDEFLEDNKDDFTKKLNAASFQGGNGEQLLGRLGEVMKSSEIAAVAKRDKKTAKAMAEANKRIIDAKHQGQYDYSQNEKSREARALQVKLTGGTAVKEMYFPTGPNVSQADEGDAKNLFEESLRRGKIEGKDLDKLDPTSISQDAKNSLAENLKVNHIRAILRENNDELYDELKQIIANNAKQALAKPGSLNEADWKKKLDNLERGEFTA